MHFGSSSEPFPAKSKGNFRLRDGAYDYICTCQFRTNFLIITVVVIIVFDETSERSMASTRAAAFGASSVALRCSSQHQRAFPRICSLTF